MNTGGIGANDGSAGAAPGRLVGHPSDAAENRRRLVRARNHGFGLLPAGRGIGSCADRTSGRAPGRHPRRVVMSSPIADSRGYAANEDQHAGARPHEHDVCARFETMVRPSFPQGLPLGVVSVGALVIATENRCRSGCSTDSPYACSSSCCSSASHGHRPLVASSIAPLGRHRPFVPPAVPKLLTGTMSSAGRPPTTGTGSGSLPVRCGRQRRHGEEIERA